MDFLWTLAEQLHWLGAEMVPGQSYHYMQYELTKAGCWDMVEALSQGWNMTKFKMFYFDFENNVVKRTLAKVHLVIHFILEDSKTGKRSDYIREYKSNIPDQPVAHIFYNQVITQELL